MISDFVHDTDLWLIGCSSLEVHEFEAGLKLLEGLVDVAGIHRDPEFSAW